MSDTHPSDNAAKTVEILNQRFPEECAGTITEEELFKAFTEVCTDPALNLGGTLFETLPSTLAVTFPEGHPRGGEKVPFTFHVAQFSKAGTPDAFAAVIYEPLTGKHLFTQDYDQNWPSWLSDYIKTQLEYQRFKIIEKKNPMRTLTVH